MARPASHLRLATRGSPLARWQADRVATRLRDQGVETSVVVVETEGDRKPTTPIDRFGGRGVFVREVQAAVVRGEADAAVHSAKDLPASADLLVPGLVIAAFPERGDSRDLVVGSRLQDLGTGATVATGSARRRAQLANLRPDLLFVELRGNIGSRLGRVGDGGVDAVVVAKAAVDRLGWVPPAGVPTEALGVRVMVPQVAQGALAVECREEDEVARAVLRAVDDGDARILVEAERAFLAELGGGCTLPVGANACWAQPAGDASAHRFSLTGMIAAYDGRMVLRHTVAGTDPTDAGRAMAEFLLDEAGGRELLGDRT